MMALKEPMLISEERVVFYHELGKALAEWATIEGALMEVVRLCVTPESRAIVGIGFTAIVGMHSKIKFADDSVVRTLHQYRRGEEIGAWERLIGRVRTQSESRNSLAHFQVAEFPENHIEGRRIALCPWKFEKRWDKTTPHSGCLCIMEVVKARLEFEAAWKSLVNFGARLVAQPEPHPKSLEQADSPPTIRQLRLQMHEELGFPHLSSREMRAIESAANASASLRPIEKETDNDARQIKASADADRGERGAAQDAGDTSKSEDDEEKDRKTH